MRRRVPRTPRPSGTSESRLAPRDAPQTRCRLQLVAGAALFSTAGAAIKACDLTSWQVASFRAGVAAIAVLLLVPAARRGVSARAALVGVVYAVTVVLFVLANKLTTAASTIFLQATSPLYIVLLQPLLLRERVARSDLGALAALGAGLVLVLLGRPGGRPDRSRSRARQRAGRGERRRPARS